MKVILINDPILREVTPDVIHEELSYVLAVIPEMIQVMKDDNGFGLAANQVGIKKRFFIMKTNLGAKLFINPEILDMTDIQPFEEGCLSIPGASAITQRAHLLKVRYFDENFNKIEEEYKGIEAVAIQHEVDHLNGKLYTDGLLPLRQHMTLNKSRKFIKMRGRRK